VFTFITGALVNSSNNYLGFGIGLDDDCLDLGTGVEGKVLVLV